MLGHLPFKKEGLGHKKKLKVRRNARGSFPRERFPPGGARVSLKKQHHAW